VGASNNKRSVNQSLELISDHRRYISRCQLVTTTVTINDRKASPLPAYGQKQRVPQIYGDTH
jgi:hypothetical protein